MASPRLSRRVAKVIRYPPLSEMSDDQRWEFQEALLDADALSAQRGASAFTRGCRANAGRSGLWVGETGLI
jgi:hypothetical protein